LPLQLVGDNGAFDVAAIDSLWVRGDLKTMRDS